MTQDTAIVSAVAAMSSEQYALLIFRILFAVLIGLAAFLASFVALLKSAKYLWDLLMDHIRNSIKDSYCTPKQLTDAVSEIKNAVEEGFASGEARFKSSDDRIALLERQVRSLPVCKLSLTPSQDCPA